MQKPSLSSLKQEYDNSKMSLNPNLSDRSYLSDLTILRGNSPEHWGNSPEVTIVEIDALKLEEITGDVFADLAREYNATIPEDGVFIYDCNCPYQTLEFISSRKDVGHGEYMNEYNCRTCGATTTAFHKMDESYMA